jgi:GNAT superfamily N-acetyltransferase
MDCLYVREAWRGRGVGHQLWKAVHAFARAQGCRTMQWQTPEWNVDAARFYRRLGALEAIKRRYVLTLE